MNSVNSGVWAAAVGMNCLSCDLPNNRVDFSSNGTLLPSHRWYDCSSVRNGGEISGDQYGVALHFNSNYRRFAASMPSTNNDDIDI
jgi:hypothetical protein